MNFSSDLGNGIFEAGGAWFTWKNAYQLWKDKKIQGVYWPMVYFFTAWGIWKRKAEAYREAAKIACALARIKYGNLDKDVDVELTRIEKLCREVF